MGRSHNTVLKRQRELKKAEKAAAKRVRKHGTAPSGYTEPQPTVRIGKVDKDETGSSPGHSET